MDSLKILQMKGVPAGTHERFARGARLRGMTQAAYLGALVDLHDAMRARADEGADDIQAELEALGLHTIHG